MDRLTLGDKLVAGGGLLYFILSFIGSWVKVEAGGGLIPGASITGNAWDGYGIVLKLSLIIALVYAGAIAAKAAGVELPAMPPVAHIAIGGAVVVLFVLQFLLGPDDEGAGAFGVEVSRGIMFFIAILPVLALGYGSYLKMQEETGPAPQFGGTPSAPPPPPGA